MRSMGAVFLVLGIVGIVLGFVPVMYTTGGGYVSMLDYNISGLYIAPLEKLRTVYVPFMFISTLLAFFGVAELVFGEVLSVDKALLLLVAYAITSIDVAKALDSVEAFISMKPIIARTGNAVLVLDTEFIRTPLYYLVSPSGVPIPTLIAIATIWALVVEIAWRIRSAETSSNKEEARAG